MERVLKIVRNEYCYSIMLKMISILIGVIQTSLVARYLGASLQGSVSYIGSIISVGSIVVTFGIHQAYAYMRKNKGKEVVYVDFISITYVLFCIYMLCAIAYAFLGRVSLEFKIAALLIPIYGYDTVVAYVCLIENPNKRNSIWTLVGCLDIFFVFIVSLFVKKGLFAAVLILFFPEIVKSIIYTYVLNVKPVFHKGLFTFGIDLFKFGFLPMLALLMTMLNYKIDFFMLSSYDFITKEQLGVYSIGMLFVDKIALIPDTLKGVLASKLSKGADAGEVAKVARICFGLNLIVCIGMFIFGKSFICLLYGNEYINAYQVILVCAFGTLFIGYFKLIAQYNIVNKKQIRNILLLTISVILNIVLNYIFIPQFQLIGAALASGVGYFCSGIIFVVWFSKQNNIGLIEMFLVKKEDFMNTK